MKVFSTKLGAAVFVAILMITGTATAQVTTFAELQNAISAAPADNSPTTILIGADFEITGTVTIPANKNITIKSDATTRTLTRGFKGTNPTTTPIFLINANGVLTFENIIVDGAKETYPDNVGSLVRVNAAATFNMNDGAVLQNNYQELWGSAVFVQKNGTFNMYGGKITGNQSQFSAVELSPM